MRVTDEMVDAAIAADSHASWWAGNNREGAEKRMRAALEAALAVEGTEAEPVAWRFELAKSVHKETGDPINWSEPRLAFTRPCAGRMQRNVTPLYTTPPAGIREADEKRAIGNGMAIAAGIVMSCWGSSVIAGEILGAGRIPHCCRSEKGRR